MKEKKKVILIVEDEKSMSAALKIKFTKEGFKVLEAINGKEGLDLFIEKKPDIVLLDILMPVMGGMEMLEKLRKFENGMHVPIIILSNSSEAQKTAEALKHGVYDYLVKSDWKLEDVVAKVKEKLKM